MEQSGGLPPLVWAARLATVDLLDRLCSPSVSRPLLSANDDRVLLSRESVNDRASGAARRRHAERVTVGVSYQLSDSMGRGLMGESVWVRV